MQIDWYRPRFLVSFLSLFIELLFVNLVFWHCHKLCELVYTPCLKTEPLSHVDYMHEALPFHCTLIVIDKFDIDQESAVLFPWQLNNIAEEDS